jgi:hypothetical protein
MLREICSSVQLCNHMTKIIIVGWDSAVSIVICYGLDGPKIESQWGRDSPHTARPTLGLTVGRRLLVGDLLVCDVRCFCAEFKHGIVFIGMLFSDKLITVVK